MPLYVTRKEVLCAEEVSSLMIRVRPVMENEKLEVDGKIIFSARTCGSVAWPQGRVC